MRLIDADAADVDKIMCYYSGHCRIEDVQEWLDDLPTIDAAPVRRGEWKKEPYLLGWTHRCNRCGENYGMPHGMFNFCPNCGADMRGEAE